MSVNQVQKEFGSVKEIDSASKGNVTLWESKTGEMQVTRNIFLKLFFWLLCNQLFSPMFYTAFLMLNIK